MRLSLRIEQTALFVLVVLVAVGVLAFWVFGALSTQVAGVVRGAADQGRLGHLGSSRLVLPAQRRRTSASSART